MDQKGRVTRGTVLVAVFLAVLMLGLPAFQVGDKSVGATGNASAAARELPVRISVINLVTAINTLNPLAYTMGQEMDVIWPCYSTLLTRDANAKIIGDLADSWYSSADGLTWHFDIVHTAQFYNRLGTPQLTPLTWADVQYTFYLARDSSGNSLQSSFPKNTAGVNVLGTITRGADDYSFDVHLNWAYAPFLAAIESLPILPKYIWSLQSKWNWANYGSGIAPCVGSGPFYYTLNGLPTASTVELARSDTWFATEERGWQVHTTKLVWKSETSESSNYNDFITNGIDVMQYVTGTQWTALASVSGAIRQEVSAGFIVEFCTNQMSDAYRSTLGAPFNHGSNNQVLLDENVRLAMVMATNRTALVAGALEGHGTVGDTLIPDSNVWHYKYGVQPSEDPIHGRAPVGEEVVQFNPAAARTLLNTAGWTYDELGNPNPNAYPLAKIGGNDVLRFNFFSVNTIPQLDAAARQVIPWMKAAGIDLETLYTVKSSNEANSAWKSANYDVWMWDWIFSPSNEPSLDIMEVMTSMSIGSWNGYFWINATYDNLYNQSLVTMDPATRQEQLDGMQRLLYDSHGVQHPAYKNDLYAMSTTNGVKWQNWGDWASHWALVPEQLMPWVYQMIYPVDNTAPQVTPLELIHNDITNNTFTLSMSANDDQNMEYRFFFGDGTKSAWLPTPSVPKSYSKDGVYTVYLAAREIGTNPLGLNDGFIGSGVMKVRIADLSNLPPTGLAFTVNPSTPTSGDIVTFTGSATDPNSDPLFYSWDFGDGHSDVGSVVTHQFAKGVDSTVAMSVDDRHIGLGERPITKSQLVPVTPNTAPTDVLGNYPNVPVRQPYTFTVGTLDPDQRDTRTVTWIWGDGKTDVTTLAYGATSSSADHTYRLKKDFTLVVWVDDGTGLPGHNASAQSLVHITDPTNHPPFLRSFAASNLVPLTGQVVSFSGRATDADGDLLTYTFDFGDGTSVVYNEVPENTVIYAEHVYTVATTPDVASAYLTAYDGQAPPVASAALDIEVFQGNRAPIITPLLERWVNVDVLDRNVTFTASATDPDGDSLTYSWDCGDGLFAIGNPATHQYNQRIPQVAYRVWVNDGNGSNVSSVAYIHVNFTFTLNLAVGWNMVSVPLIGQGYKASTLGLLTDDIVSGWNSSSRSYDKNYIIGRSPARNDFAIEASTGYWIYVSVARPLVLLGDVPETAQTKDVTVPAGGWALISFEIGFDWLSTTRNASDIKAMFTGGNVTTVATYITATGAYKVYIGTPRTDFLLVPGQAYWIYCDASGVLSYNP